MATKLRKVTPRKKITLEDDGLVSEELQKQLHDAPSEVHYERATEAVSMDRNMVPICSTVAELLSFVIGVQACSGNPVAMKEVLDRFAPKAARNATNVDVNVQGAASPIASQNSEEQGAATSYMDSLRAVK
jgi:hypothetical protein